MQNQNQVPEFHTLLPEAFLYSAICLAIIKVINPIIGDPRLVDMQLISIAAITLWYLKKGDSQPLIANLTALVTIDLIMLTKHTINNRLVWTYVALAACAKIFEFGLRFVRQRRRAAVPQPEQNGRN